MTRWHSDLARVVAVAALTAAWAFGAIPLAPVPAVVGIAMFNIVAVRSPVKRAVTVGLQQMVLGIAVVVITGVAVLA